MKAINSLNSFAFVLMACVLGCSSTGPMPNASDCIETSQCPEGTICADGLCVELADASDSSDPSVPNDSDAADPSDDASDVTDTADASDAADATEPVEEPEPNVPVVTFSSPAEQSTFEQADSITFTATVSDVTEEDGPFAVAWQSNVDGVLFEQVDET